MSQTEQLSAIADADVDSFSMLVRGKDGSVLRYVDQASYPWIDDLQSENRRSTSKIVRITTPFTLLPSSDFDSTMISRIAQQAFPLEAIDYVQHFMHEGIAAVYIISNELRSRLSNQFADYRIEHVFESLIKLKTNQDSSILAHWTSNGLLIIAHNNGLRLANYYKISAPEDAIYYILSAYKYAELDPLKDSLSMSGRISKDGILFDKVAGFIKDFYWLNQECALPQDFPFDPHLFYHLM